jgi:repressor LexA
MPTGKLSGRRREIYEYLINTSRERGYPPTMREIAHALGLASPSTVLHHLRILEEQGYIEREPARNRALRPSSWGGGDNQNAQYVPLIGRVAAGAPLLAAENLEGYLPLPQGLFGTGELFMLQVQGESMIGAGILEGDYVIVSQQPSANDGDIVVALLGEEATVKRLYRRADHVELRPENPTMEPILADDVQVLGKVVGVVRSVS